MGTNLTAWQTIAPQSSRYQSPQTAPYLNRPVVQQTAVPADGLDRLTMIHVQSNVSLAQQSLSRDDLALAAEYLSQAVRLLSQVAPDVAAPQPPAKAQAAADGRLNKLSDREREVLQLLVEGKPTALISKLLHVSIATVYTYHRRIKTKLDLYDLPSLIKFALDHQLVE